ncbi:hypothetical protein [Leptolyngbya phage Lbo-JY46]
MIKIINTNLAEIIKVWEIDRSYPINKDFLDNLIRQRIGKKGENYYIFNLEQVPNINAYNPDPASLAFNLCKNALITENKHKRKERYTHFMFTY